MKKTCSMIAAALVALAAGTAWGADTLLIGGADPLYLNADGSLSVGTVIGYYGTTATRQFDFNLYYGLVGETTTNKVTMLQTGKLKPATTSGSSAIWKAVNFTTDPIPGIASGKDVWLYIEYKNTVYDTGTAAPTSAQDLTKTSDVVMIDQSYFRGVRARWTNSPFAFVISGVVTPGFGYVSARLTYALNASALDSGATVATATPDAEDGSFSFTIPFTGMTDKIVWKIEFEDGDGNWELYTSPSGDSVFTTAHTDEEHVTYTWTGNGDGVSWTDVDNWEGVSEKGFDPGACYGYPGLAAADGYYRSIVSFDSDAVVNLEGGRYGFLDDGGFFIGAGVSAALTNGTLNLNTSPYTLGASGSTLTFGNVRVVRANSAWTETAGQPYLDFASGSTTVFEGTSTATWSYRPTLANAKIVIRNGTTSSRYQTATAIKTTTTLEITNAVWSVTSGNVTSGTGYVTTFRDGPDRQARLTTGTGQTIDLRYTYDIEIPAAGRSVATIQAGYLTSDTTVGTFRLDVTDYESDEPVPLVKFSTSNSTNKGYNNTRVPSQISNGYLKLVALRNGKDVTAKRNASLVWNNSTQTIYYQQDKVYKGTMFFVH